MNLFTDENFLKYVKHNLESTTYILSLSEKEIV